MKESPLHSPLGMLVALVVLTCLGASQARTCDRHQFWSAFFNKCMNCTTCQHPDIVITPCQGHRDTVCGPLSDLKIDWSWMRQGNDHKKERVKEMTETFKENMQEIKLHEMHVKEKEKMMERLQKMQKQKKKEKNVDKAEYYYYYDDDDDDYDDNTSEDTPERALWKKLTKYNPHEDVQNQKITDRILKNLKGTHIINEHPKVFEAPHDEILQSLHFNSKEAKALLKSASRETPDVATKSNDPVLTHEHFGFFPVEDEGKTYDGVTDDYDASDDGNGTNDDPEVSEKELEFSTTERMVLDYQAGVLYAALASIAIFFFVALCYTLKHLRAWTNYNYKEDIEELKSWLWTQSHGPSDKHPPKTFPSTIYKSTTEVVSKPSSGQCKYLERIITKNAKKKINRVPQNIYHGAHPSIETKPLTSSTDDLEVHKPICI